MSQQGGPKADRPYSSLELDMDMERVAVEETTSIPTPEVSYSPTAQFNPTAIILTVSTPATLRALHHHLTRLESNYQPKRFQLTIHNYLNT